MFLRTFSVCLKRVAEPNERLDILYLEAAKHFILVWHQRGTASTQNRT